ncbi:hypothetical protein B0J14DRAFT_593252 [Halenospora varia]|nr:hypothetical protein B0J14DRAFT_593252 [Halenospora varia]
MVEGYILVERSRTSRSDSRGCVGYACLEGGIALMLGWGGIDWRGVLVRFLVGWTLAVAIPGRRGKW